MSRMYQWRKKNTVTTSEHRRKYKVRSKLRERGYLPPVGSEMTEEQRLIYEQIGNNDYSFWDDVKLNKRPHDGGVQIRNPFLEKTNEQLILERTKQSAKERGLDFNLTIDDIVIPEYCPYLNLKLTFIFTYETRNSYYSIDRINNNLGYVKNNVQIISLKANTMKNNATQNELLIFANNIITLNS